MNTEQNIVEMNLCTEGTAEALISGEKHTLQQGFLFVTSPIVHAFILEQSKDFTLCTISGTMDNIFPAVEPVFDTIIKNRLYQQPSAMLDTTQQQHFLLMAQHIHQKQEEMQAENRGDIHLLISRIISQLQRTAILETIQLLMQQQHPVSKQTSKLNQTAFNFLNTLHDNFKTERNVAFYADLSGLSPNHFTHVVKQVTGRTPMEWINTFTILEAKRLLLKKGARVKDAAGQLNFPDQYTFTRYFKTHSGTTPKDYQRPSSHDHTTLSYISR